MTRILGLVAGYPPGYRLGGPGRSVFNLVGTLGGDFEFSILTSDRDLGDAVAYPGIPADRWIADRGGRVRYCSPAMLRARALAGIIRETPHDILYLNGFFAPRFSVAPLLARRFGALPPVPTILAPRGEFSAGALALKQGRKRAYMAAAKVLGLLDGLHWQASTPYERADIERSLGVARDRISVASNLAAPLPEAPPPHVARVPGAPLRVVFLSRISPKKNLDFALRVLSGLALPVTFSIIGPEEDAAYAARCRALADGLPGTITVEWVGALPPGAVARALADHDLFFLPTRGENFGHVIAEALGAGTPVLLSDTTPWRGLARLGIGQDLPLDAVERFRDALRDAWHQSPDEAARMRRRAARHARARQQDGTDAEAHRAMFRRALSAA